MRPVSRPLSGSTRRMSWQSEPSPSLRASLAPAVVISTTRQPLGRTSEAGSKLRPRGAALHPGGHRHDHDGDADQDQELPWR